MKTRFKYLALLLLACYACEPDSISPNENVQSKNEVPLGYIDSTSSNYSNYEWKMVVNTVDSYYGTESEKVYIDILLGKPIPSGIYTTNTTYFGISPNSNNAYLKLPHYGWSLWEANGFYPIEWDFHYALTENQFELEGFANMALTYCEDAEGALITNRFYFKGDLDTKVNEVSKYSGTFKWEESYESGICISIEGQMDVIRDKRF